MCDAPARIGGLRGAGAAFLGAGRGMPEVVSDGLFDLPGAPQTSDAYRGVSAGAPLAVAAALVNALRTGRPMSVPVPEPGRANVIACSRYLPGDNRDCGWASDSREVGLALGAN